MIKIVRIAVITVFVLSLGVFTAAKVIEYTSSDSTLPVIKCDSETLEIPCNYTEEQLLEGVSAFDENDGDLTDKILIGDFSRFSEKGVCTLNYVVFDTANQPATLTRKIRFTDYRSPRFTLSQPLVFTENKSSYAEAVKCIGAQDILSGDLTDWLIQTDSNVNFRNAGTYHLAFEVTNRFGDTASIKLPVHIVPDTANEIDITLTDNILYLDKNETVNPSDYIEKVTTADGKAISKSAVAFQSNINTSIAGVYEITYTAKLGNRTGNTWLTVIVTD